MSKLSATSRRNAAHQPLTPGREQRQPVRREESNGSLGWLAAGAAVLAVGYLAWQHFGPDFRRYLKMREM